MWSVWIHAEKQQQVHRQGSNITDHSNQRALECANSSIHYRASLSPSLLAPWSSVLLPICLDFSPFISCMEDSRLSLMIHINILSRKTHVWSKVTQLHLGWWWETPATLLDGEETTQKSLGPGKRGLFPCQTFQMPFVAAYSSEVGNTHLGTWTPVPPALQLSSRWRMSPETAWLDSHLLFGRASLVFSR